MTGKPASKTEYESSIERFLQSDMDLAPLIQGIADAETAQKWLGEANRVDADLQTKKQIAERIRELE